MQFTADNAHAVIEWLGRACVGRRGHVDGRVFDIRVRVAVDKSETVWPGYWIVRDPWDHFRVLTEDEFTGDWMPDV